MARKSSAKSGSKAKAKLDAATRIAILHGPDDMKKREAYDELREALVAEHGEIDPIVFDGKDVELATVLDELRTFGLLQSHKLVVVDNADQFVSDHRQVLERYAEEPSSSATLVLRSVNWRAGNFDKKVAKVGAKIDCKPPNRADAAKWLVRRAKAKHRCELTGDGAAMLVDRMGVDLMRLDSELGKLAAMVNEGEAIGPDVVEQLVGKSSDEQAWAIQEAILEALSAGSGPKGGNAAGRAIEKLHELIDLGGQPEVLVAWAIEDLARKIHVGMMLRGQRVSDAEVGKRLRLWGPQRGLMFGLLRRLSPRATGRLFDRAVDMDRRGKSGLGTPMRNLECFCAALADELN